MSRTGGLTPRRSPSAIQLGTTLSVIGANEFADNPYDAHPDQWPEEEPPEQKREDKAKETATSGVVFEVLAADWPAEDRACQGSDRVQAAARRLISREFILLLHWDTLLSSHQEQKQQEPINIAQRWSATRTSTPST